MQVNTICLRCHQKCHLVAEVVDGKIVAVGDASTLNRTAACAETCPIGMDVPGYLVAASQGKFQEAMEIIRRTNPFPAVCGRICHHPCDAECIRSIYDEPLAIQGIKRFVTDRAIYAEKKPLPVKSTKKEKIAIIGSGPTGLTAAHDLVKEGYQVTVFESAAAPGGMLATVIPEFKLPSAVLQADIQYIKALGVQIKTNTPIGKDISIDTLLKHYNAVLIAIGCWKPLTRSIPGSDLNNVHMALPFLQSAKQGETINLSGKVVVIGGGNTAIDTARTALRMGADEAHVACLECRRDMPAHTWEMEIAESEGVVLHPSLAPQHF